MKLGIRILFIFLFCALVMQNSKASLATYSFTSDLSAGNNGSATFSAVTGGSGVTVTSSSGAAVATGLSQSTSVDVAKYVQFTITAVAGNKIDISDITFLIRSSLPNGGSDKQGPTSGEIAVFFGTTAANAALNTAGYTSTYSITPSGTTFVSNSLNPTDETTSQDVVIRFYGWNSGSNPNASMSFDNIAITYGVTPVPEPINYSLAAFGLFFIGGGISRFYFRRLRSV